MMPPSLVAAHLQVRDAVGKPLVIKLAHLRHLLFAERRDQNAATLEGEAQLVVQLLEHQVASYLQACLQAADRVVKASMHDT